MKINSTTITHPLTIPFTMLSLVSPWLIGIVLAQGFWQTLFTIFIPPYSWYLFIEKLMTEYHFLIK